MIAKTLTGVPFFDRRYGGTYRGRALLVTGRSGSGKTVLGLQFVAQGVKLGERCLMLSAQPAADLMIAAESLGLNIAQAVDSGILILLEYNDYIPGRDREENLTLPPDGFTQLQEIIDHNAIQRVVLDTAIPWVSRPAASNIAEHVFSFVRAFDRLGTTTMLTLPKPVSPMSSKLRHALEDVTPVSITLSYEPDTDERQWIVGKYLGEKKLDAGTPFVIENGCGIMEPSEVPAVAPKAAAPAVRPQEPAPAVPVGIPSPPPAPAAPAPFQSAYQAAVEAAPRAPSSGTGRPPAPAPKPLPAAAPSKKILFSNVVFNAESPVGAKGDRPFRWGVTFSK